MCSAYFRPSRMWITFKRFSTVFEVFVPHLYLCCIHCIIPDSVLNHLNSFGRVMFKFNRKFDADFCCTQSSWMWWPPSTHAHSTASIAPLTSTVKSSLFTHVYSSSLSLAARVHWCHASHFVTLTMAGLFPDRTCISIYPYVYAYVVLFVWE